jgi:hypothetical protein
MTLRLAHRLRRIAAASADDGAHSADPRWIPDTPVSPGPHDLHAADAGYIALLVGDDAPSPVACGADPGAEGRLSLGEDPMHVRVHASGADHVDLVVPYRPSAFDWQCRARAVFEYVDHWGVCRIVGPGTLVPADSSMTDHEHVVRVGTTGRPQRLLRRRHMSAAIQAPVFVTDGLQELHATTVGVTAGELHLDRALELTVGQAVTFVLHLYRPVTGLAQVLRVTERGTAIGRLDLDARARTRLELGIFGAARP